MSIIIVHDGLDYRRVERAKARCVALQNLRLRAGLAPQHLRRLDRCYRWNRAWLDLEILAVDRQRYRQTREIAARLGLRLTN